VLAFTVPATLRLFAGKGTQHDAVKFSYTLFALMVLGFNFKWLLMPESMLTADVLRGLGIAVALFLLAIIRVYRAN
jgi:hypothetical protein